MTVETARPRAGGRWAGFRWAILLALVVLGAALVAEQRAAASLAPGADTQFGNEQPVTVPLAAGRSRVVYAKTDSARDSVDCQVAPPEVGAPIGGDVFVGNWMAVLTLTSATDSVARVACDGAADARFGVGAAIGPPHPFDGVQQAPAAGQVVLSVALVVFLAVAFVVSPANGKRQAWIYWYWTPLLMTAAMAYRVDRVLPGIVAGVLALTVLLVVNGIRSLRPPWWAWAVGTAVVGLLIVGMIREGRSATALEPPPDARFGNQQTLSLPLGAGEARVVYFNFEAVATKRARRAGLLRVDCEVVPREPAVGITREALDTMINVRNWRAVMRVQAAEAVTVDVSCRGPARARYGVGPALPPQRMFDGIDRGSNGFGMALVGLIFLAGALVVVWIVPLDAARKRSIYRFWAPVVAGVVVTVAMNSLWNGVGLAVLALLLTNVKFLFRAASTQTAQRRTAQRGTAQRRTA